MTSYLAAVPKAELHLHFQGAIRPATLLELAQRHGIPLPVEDVAGLRQWFQFRDFAHFVEVYALLRACLVTPEDFELVTHELGAELAAQQVRYAEVTFTPGPEVYRGPRETFFDGLTRGRERVLEEFGVELRWIFDIPRRTVTLHPDLPLADFITDVAINGRDDGVVALGLAGTENGYPPEPFEPWFDRARAAGLHSAPHAEYLVEHCIPLEVCPTSNVRLGVYSSLEEHPLRRLHDTGALITINTDTPAIFDINLTGELALLETSFGLQREAVERIVLNAFEASFLSPEERASLSS